jgi:hypothetical protein
MWLIPHVSVFPSLTIRIDGFFDKTEIKDLEMLAAHFQSCVTGLVSMNWNRVA